MTRINFIKSVYWIAAAVDAAVALGMVFPPLIQPALQIAASPTTVEARYALGTGAALMSGWTALSRWGWRRSQPHGVRPGDSERDCGTGIVT